MAIKTITVDLTVLGDVTADAFITNGGASTDFVKGDGTLDSSTYDNYIRWDLEVNGTHQLYITTDQVVDLVGTAPIVATYSAGGVVTFTHLNTNGNKHLPSGGVADQWLKWSALGTASWENLSSIGTNSPFELVTSDAAATTAVENTNYTFSNSSGDFDITFPASPTDGAYFDVYLHDINTFNITNTVSGGEPTYADTMIIRVIYAGLGQYYVETLYDPATTGSGTVTSVSAGNGMDFTTITATGAATMGTPSSLTGVTTNAVTATSHTHAITTAAVTNGSTALVDGNDVYDFVIGLGYSTQTLTASDGTTLDANNIELNIMNLTDATGTTNVGGDSMVYYDLSLARHVFQDFSEVHLSAFDNDLNWNAYSLPLATSTVRGGIELFSNTDNPTAANSVTSTASRTYGLQLNSSNQGVVNVPWTDTVYTHPNHSGQVTSTGDGATVVTVSAITAQTLGTVIAGADEWLYSDSGVIKRVTTDTLAGYMDSNLNFGSMSSWIIKEGNGSETTTVSDGETLTIADADFIVSEMTSTTSGGTITLSVNYDTENTWTRQQGFGMTSDGESTATFAWDLNRYQVNKATMTYNGVTAISNPTNGVAGHTYILIMVQGTNTTTITWGTNYKFPGGTVPQLSGTLNDVDIFTFVYDGTNMYCVAQQDFS